MPDITLTLTEQDQQLFRAILHAAQVQMGLDGTDIVKHIKDKVVQAQQEAERIAHIAAKNAELNAANAA